MAENELQQVHNLLIQLQDVLKKKFALESEIEELPKNLSGKRTDLIKANEEFLALTDKYKLAKETANRTALDYETAFNQRVSSEKKMESVATQREFDALSKEIEEAKITETGLNKAKKATQEEVDSLSALVAEKQTALEEMTNEVNAAEAELEAQVEAKKAEIVTYEEACQSIKAQGVSDNIYTKFASIVKNKNGLGIVPVHGQVCQGCNMILPVQFVNDVRIGNSTMYCPYCSRILFYEESEDAYDYTSELQVQDEEDQTVTADFGSDVDIDLDSI
ncbi:MAG: DNA-binding protein [Sphaerochaetaceae bacterium]|nr:DNA-binding protein [Sphaerochaetaceae bacterium]